MKIILVQSISFFVKTLPAEENNLSDGTEVAGIAKQTLA